METIHEVVPLFPRRSASLRPHHTLAPLPASPSSPTPRSSSSNRPATANPSIGGGSSSLVGTTARDKSYRKRVPPPLALVQATASPSVDPSSPVSPTTASSSRTALRSSLEQQPRSVTAGPFSLHPSYTRTRRSSLSPTSARPIHHHHHHHQHAIAIGVDEYGRRGSASSSTSDSTASSSASSATIHAGTTMVEDRRGSDGSAASTAHSIGGGSVDETKAWDGTASTAPTTSAITTSKGYVTSTSSFCGTPDIYGYHTTTRAREAKVHVLNVPTAVSFVPTDQPQTAISITEDRIVIDTIYPPTLSSCSDHDGGADDQEGGAGAMRAGDGGPAATGAKRNLRGDKRRTAAADTIHMLRDHEASLLLALEQVKTLHVGSTIEDEIELTVRGTTVFPPPLVGARMGAKATSSTATEGQADCPCICCSVGCTAPHFASTPQAGIETRLAPLPAPLPLAGSHSSSSTTTASSMPPTPTTPYHRGVEAGEVLPPIFDLHHHVDPSCDPDPYEVKGPVVSRSVRVDPVETTRISSINDPTRCPDTSHLVAGQLASNAVVPPPRRSSKLYAVGARRGARSSGNLPATAATAATSPSSPTFASRYNGTPTRGISANEGVIQPRSGRRSLDSSLAARPPVETAPPLPASRSALVQGSATDRGEKQAAVSVLPRPPLPPLPASEREQLDRQQPRLRKKESTLSRLRRSLSTTIRRKRASSGAPDAIDGHEGNLAPPAASHPNEFGAVRAQ
ncbi:uncharacterized protein PSFLO_05847 [Pseudozyma flocculosa]|uniref:Uncharacterized protein n=1 Tax=Pseudozyma flocculosa TaxID=84751 RepID=A0A5C3F9P5_9BASI|nr:uncharacterized protein PSFLO_05847 [Pseudozyma flocculosa]